MDGALVGHVMGEFAMVFFERGCRGKAVWG
jgi:hypothetical protein